MKMKTCNTCKQEFPATTEYFYKYERNTGGLFHCCKKCKQKNQKQYRQRIGKKEYQTTEGIPYRKYMEDDAPEYQYMKSESKRFEALNDREILYGFLHVLFHTDEDESYNTEAFPHLKPINKKGKRGKK